MLPAGSFGHPGLLWSGPGARRSTDRSRRPPGHATPSRHVAEIRVITTTPGPGCQIVTLATYQSSGIFIDASPVLLSGVSSAESKEAGVGMVSEDRLARGSTAVSTAADGPLLSLRQLSKSFPGVRALDDVSLDIHGGEVHALLGANGCGKSTLIKILAGFHEPDQGGSASFDGVPYPLGRAGRTTDEPIRFVHQDLGLINELNTIDNCALSLGYIRSSYGRIDWAAEVRRARLMLERFGVNLDVWRPLSEASPVERTIVAIARALANWHGSKHLLVLDEPTAALSSAEVKKLFGVLRELRSAGAAMLYVSHRMDEIFEIADRVTVMREGKVVDTCLVRDTTPAELSSMIAGDRTASLSTVREVPSGNGSPAVLKIENLTAQKLDGINLALHKGEILGVAGLLGSGREDLGYAVVGARDEARGTWTIDGQSVRSLTPTRAVAAGIGFVPADRTRESLIQGFRVRENLSAAVLSRLGRRLFLARKKERDEAARWLAATGVRSNADGAPIETLSGGNQQKVVVARWLWNSPKVLVLCEPTAGVDIAARQSIYSLLKEQASAGLSVFICSSDVQDLVEMCDRVLVMRDGRITAELTGSEISTRTIVNASEGIDA